MEVLFMQAFESQEAAEAQMRQQAASYSQTLARSLLAAGHLPPPWLLPRPAALANLDPRGAAEAQMRRQVESHSQLLASALLAAGHRPPEWLVQQPTDVATHGTTETNGLVNPGNVHHVHNSLTETNHQSKQETLEVVVVKPGIMNMSTSADRCQKCASETAMDSTGMHSSNENPSLANSFEVPHSDVSLLLQNETLHPVEPDFLLPEKETTCAAETEPPEGPRSSTSSLLETAGNAVRKVLVDLANKKCSDHVHHVFPEIKHWEKTPEAVDVKRVIMNITSSAEANQCQKCTRETVIDYSGMCASSKDLSPANYVEEPHSAFSLLLHNNTLHSFDADFVEAPHPITITSPQKEATDTAETEPVDDPRSIANSLIKIDSLHSLNTNFLEVLDSLAATNPENDSTDTAKNDSIELSYSMVSLVVEKSTLHSDEGNILEGNNSIASLLHGKEPILTDSLEGAHCSLLEKDTLPCVHTNHHEENYFMSCVWLDQETTDATEHESFEGPSSMASPLVENGSSHSTKFNFLEEPDCVSSRLPENDAIEIVENVSIEVSQCTTSVQFEKGKLHSAVDIEVPDDRESSIANVLLEKGPISVESLEGQHGMVSPPVEKDMSCSAETVFIQGTYSIPSLLLDKEAEHTSETASLERPFCLVSQKIEKDHLNTIAFDVPVMLGMPQVNVLEDNCGSFSRSHESIVADDPGSLHLHENVLEDDRKWGLCSHLGKLQPKHTDDGDAITNCIISSETIITLSDSTTGRATNAFVPLNDSSIGSAKDVFVSVESESSQMQSSVAELECVMTSKAVEAHMASAALFTSVECIRREDSVQCQPKQSDHAHIKFSDKDTSETPDVSSGASSKRAGILHTAESNITTNESLQTLTGRQNSTRRSYEHLCASASGEKFSSAEPHVQRTASYLDKLSASRIQVTQNSPSKNAAMTDQSDHEIYDSSSTMSTSSSPDNQDDIHDQIKTRGNLSGKGLPSHFDRLGSCECISPNSERTNSSNNTSPLAHEVQAAANYSPECSMSNLSDAIHCNSPIWQASLCSRSSLNNEVTAIDQHSQSYSSAKNLDTAFASLASCADFQADGERHYLRQENSSIECPNGDVKTARAEDYSKFNETMQECQRFSIPVPSNSLTINDRASQAFYESTELIKLSSRLSAKYKTKPLDGVYQSLPSRFEKLMNRPLSHSIDTKLLDPSYDSKKLGVFGKYSLDFDGAFMMSNDRTYDSSNAFGVQEDSNIPLAHENHNLENLSGRTGSSSDYLDSIPELDCFRIDEDNTIQGENKNQMKLSGSIGRSYPRQGLAAKKPLGYTTNIYQSNGTCCVEWTHGKYHTRKPDRRVNQDIKNPKENRAPSIRKDGKVNHPLLDRFSKTEMSSSKSERNKSGTNPRNIISNMTSFIPLVKQKQRPPASCVKRDLRVRALEAAEAAKRREEKKKTDREKRKAAVKLERERLKQEKEHRQKQVELQKKKDADIVTRKRQRENDGKRATGRKKKCVQEAPKHQKPLLMHSTNAVRDACPNKTDGKDLEENLARGVKNQILYDERMESVHKLTASESNSLKAASMDFQSEGSKLQVQGSLSDDLDKSYEMSPYEDSDEEDFNNFEHEREMRRTCKLIPSWAQKENLNKILLSNQALDPREVFARKCSFVLSDVLTLGIPHRLLN